MSTFPERERGPAIGTWTAWGTIAGAVGPLLAGAILDVTSWRWIFVVEAVAIRRASDQSSLDAFRVGIGVEGALVIIGGLIGAAGIRNPPRVVQAEQSPGGQLAGSPLDAAGVHTSQRV